MSATRLAEAPFDWHAADETAVLRELGTDLDGLSESGAAARLARDGPNILLGNALEPRWKLFLRQFASPLIFILVLCMVITLLLRDWVDSIAIAAALLINAVVGYYQESKAQSRVSALQSRAEPTTRVVRDSTTHQLPSRDVVRGDIVLLEAGDQVTADLRLVQTNALRIDESLLTGESKPVHKTPDVVPAGAVLGDHTSMAYSGTSVVAGRGVGVVVATGDHSQLGRINELVQADPPLTDMQVQMNRLEKLIGAIVAVAACGLFVVGLVRGANPELMFMAAVALAVSSIPESLKIVQTVAMSLGVTRMAKRRAIVRRLPAVETLGSTTVIGSDKTGTLTQNRMTVVQLWTPDGRSSRLGDGTAESAPPTAAMGRMLRAGALTNEASRGPSPEIPLVGDAVDVAMATVALRHGVVTVDEVVANPELEIPYEPERAFSQTIWPEADGLMLYVKGAPGRLLDMSVTAQPATGDDPLDIPLVRAAIDGMARQGLRVIATACRPLTPGEDPHEALERPGGLTFLGLQGLEDPPRPGVAEAIQECRSAGITVKMITGDNPTTASAIGRRLGIELGGAEPLTGTELARLTDDELAARLGRTNIAARVTPRDKLTIVESLQSTGEVVAVTGDGVNDAPALRSASVGVAMGRSGTDVARESADIVLTDDAFVTIVESVRQGRVTFAAVRKSTFFLLSTAVTSLVAVSVNLFINTTLLFLPIQMLWLNLVTSGVQDLALAFEPAEGDELTRRPRPRGEGILSGRLWVRASITGGWMALVVVLAFEMQLLAGASVEHARSFAITTFVACTVFQALNSRGETRSVFRTAFFSNRFLIIGMTVSVLVHALAMVVPVTAELFGFVALSWGDWVVCFLLGGTVAAVSELSKLFERRARSSTV